MKVNRNRVFKASSQYVDFAQRDEQTLAVSLKMRGYPANVQVRLASRSTGGFGPFQFLKVRVEDSRFWTLDKEELHGLRLNKFEVQVCQDHLSSRLVGLFCMEHGLDKKLVEWLTGLAKDEGFEVSEDLPDLIQAMLLEQLVCGDVLEKEPMFQVKEGETHGLKPNKHHYEEEDSEDPEEY